MAVDINAKAQRVTLRSLATQIGAALLGYIAAGASAVFRTIQDKLRETVSVKDFGAVGNGSTDDSAAFQAALDYVESIGGGAVNVPRGNWRVRDITVAAKCHLIGAGEEATVLRFMQSGDNLADSSTWTVVVDGSFSSVRDLTIEGTVSGTLRKGNGLRLVPDANGMQRRVSNVRIQNFSGYRSAPTGGTYGVNAEFARSDISDGSGSHLLVGGNGFQCYNSGGAAWNLEVDHVTVGNCDGIGFDCGNISDSKLTNIYVGSCTGPGWLLDQGNSNCQIHNVKVFRCNVLNPTVSFATTLDYVYPHELTVSVDKPAVVLTGANHCITNFEAQENGSTGFGLGSNARGLHNCFLHLIADGNGGYDKDADAGTQADYRRYGILGRNYYAVQLSGVCDDFRAKFNLPRQLRGLHLIGTKDTFTSLGATAASDWFKIKATTGGADFTPMQLGLASTSNTVGFVFQARTVYGSGYGAATFGSGGQLEAVNDRLHADLVIINQYEQDQGTGTGYSVGSDGSSSCLIVNGAIIKMPAATAFSATTLNGTTINAVPAAAGDVCRTVTVVGEANPRFRQYGNGKMEWGAGGASAPDAALDRIGAAVMGVPSTMMIRTGLGATGSRPAAPVAGAQWYDTTLSKPIWYDGAAWRDAAGTAV